MVKNAFSGNGVLLTSVTLLSLGIGTLYSQEVKNDSLESKFDSIGSSQNLKGVDQYFLTKDSLGCEILNKISYLSSDGKLFNSYSSYLIKSLPDQYCKRD